VLDPVISEFVFHVVEVHCMMTKATFVGSVRATVPVKSMFPKLHTSRTTPRRFRCPSFELNGYKVTLSLPDGGSAVIDCEEDTYILDAAEVRLLKWCTDSIY